MCGGCLSVAYTLTGVRGYDDDRLDLVWILDFDVFFLLKLNLYYNCMSKGCIYLIRLMLPFCLLDLHVFRIESLNTYFQHLPHRFPALSYFIIHFTNHKYIENTWALEHQFIPYFRLNGKLSVE